MARSDVLRRRPSLVVAALMVIGTLIRIPQLSHTLAESFGFRQTQTAWVVKEFARNGIDLLHTPLPVFGPGADVPIEFPIWQAIASIPVSAGMPVDVAVRILGLLSFQAVAVLLVALLVRWHGWAVAIVAVTIFEFFPYGLLWGAASLIDFFAVAAAMLMVLGIDRWLHDRSVRWLVIGGVGAIVAFLVKVTTVPTWGLLLVVSALLLLRSDGWRRSWRRIALALTGPVVALAAAAAWTAYADGLKSTNPLTSFLTSGALRDWTFGTIAQRLDPPTYQVIIGRIGDEIAGPKVIGLVLAIVAAIFLPTLVERARLVGWIAVAVAAPLIFFNLYFVHNYYLIGIYPAIVAAMAVGLVWLVRLIPGARWQRLTVLVLLLTALFASIVTNPVGHNDVTQFVHGRPVPLLSRSIAAATPPDGLVVTIGCTWDPTWLYYANREGMMFRGSDDAGYWRDHDIADYTTLAVCESDLDPGDFLPAGYGVENTGSDDRVFHIVQEDDGGHSVIARLTHLLRVAWNKLVRYALKFGVVGLAGYFVDVGIFNLLRLGVFGTSHIFDDPIPAKIVSVFIATLVTWFGNRYWTFREHRRKNYLLELMEFSVVSLGGLLIGLLCLWVSHYVLGFDNLLADNISSNVIGLFLGTTFRFLLYRFWVYGHHRQDGLAARERKAEAAAITIFEDEQSATEDAEGPVRGPLSTE